MNQVAEQFFSGTKQTDDDDVDLAEALKEELDGLKRQSSRRFFVFVFHFLLSSFSINSNTMNNTFIIFYPSQS
jgi:hypothetical protein